MTANSFPCYHNVDKAEFVQRSGLEYHLGNVGLSYKSTSTTGVALQIVEGNDYYSSGLGHEGYNSVMGDTENQIQTF